VAEIIDKAHAESEEGTFVPFRDIDELNCDVPPLSKDG
jgi:hypothetical protein